MNPEILVPLRTILATLYEEETAIRQLLADARVDAARIKFNTATGPLWHFLLIEVNKNDQVHDLLAVAERDYSRNNVLRDACAAYRRAVSQATSAPAPPSWPTSQPVAATHRPLAVALSQPLINHDQAVALFQQMLLPRPPHQVLRLEGAANMGKTTLLSKIFPALAAQHGVRWVGIDLRNPAQSPSDLLEAACHQLDPDLFPNFNAAYKALLAEPTQNAQSDRTPYEPLPSAPTEQPDAIASVRPPLAHLTHKFVDDLRALSGATWLLLFDAVDLAHPATQSWLMDDLLDRLRPLTHVRVVVAGRPPKLPAASSYAACCNHVLNPVLEVEAYIRYCRAVKANVPEDHIPTLAHVFEYIPGSFANAIRARFMSGGLSSD